MCVTQQWTVTLKEARFPALNPLIAQTSHRWQCRGHQCQCCSQHRIKDNRGMQQSLVLSILNAKLPLPLVKEQELSPLSLQTKLKQDTWEWKQLQSRQPEPLPWLSSPSPNRSFTWNLQFQQKFQEKELLHMDSPHRQTNNKAPEQEGLAEPPH